MEVIDNKALFSFGRKRPLVGSSIRRSFSSPAADKIEGGFLGQSISFAGLISSNSSHILQDGPTELNSGNLSILYAV